MFKEIVKNVWVIDENSFENNTYIIVEKNTCVVIDPSSYYDEIVKFIEDKHLKFLAIILTHSHFDHFGISNDLANKYKVKIYVHENEKPMFDMLVVKEFADVPKQLKFKMSELDWNNIVLYKDHSLKFDDIEFNIIFTPGHTYGGVVLVYNKNIYFTGDTLFPDGIGMMDLPGADINTLLHSLYKITRFIKDDDYVLSGHHKKYSQYKDFYKTNPYIQQVLSKDFTNK